MAISQFKPRRRSIQAAGSGALTLLVALLLVALVGCGSSSPDREPVLRGVYSAFPDSLDPAYSVTIEGWTALYNTYLPLLTYAHADGAAGARLVPALAERLPKVTNHGRTYTLVLRPGLRYSNDRPIRASDFKFSIERLFRANSPGSVFYTGIVGAQRFAATHSGGISGITVDNGRRTIRIDLIEPSGTFTYQLGLIYAALLPPGTPSGDQTKDPPPASGPYEIPEVDYGHGWRYRRNPLWRSTNGRAMPELPAGHLDRIEFSVIQNSSTAVHEVERGNYDLLKTPPPPDLYPSIKDRFQGTQFRTDPNPGVLYFWMNTSRPPFDDVRVRRAVNYAVNPRALQRIYAGTIKPTQQVLPPGLPGHRTYMLFPYDPSRARRLIAVADPLDRKITVWTLNEPPNLEAAEYYEGVLRELGFEPKLKAIFPSSYFSVIGNSTTPDLDTGISNWLQDYPHPNDFLEPQLTAAAITAVNNSNYAQFDDPATSAQIRRLSRQQLGPSQEAQYARLDEQIMGEAPWAPFGSTTTATFVSEDVDLNGIVVSPIFSQDLTSIAFKQE
jgi:peptide/nickel transport system substrate-binding protein